MDWACITYGERRGAYRVLVWRHEGRRPFGRPRHEWRTISKWIIKNSVGEGTGGLD
jgi:hypothetical protein